MNALRHQVYAVVEGGRLGYPLGRLFDAALITLVIANVAAIVLGTLPDLAPAWRQAFDALEIVAVVVFTIEYGLRIWVAVEDGRRRFHHPLWGRLRWMATPLALVDLATVLPFYLSHLIVFDPTMAGLVRMLRLVKLLRYMSAFDTIATVIYMERRPLIAGASILAAVLVVISTLAYFAERGVQPDKFGSIPDAMWWGLVTLSTVGYGDLTPVTPLGRIIGGIATVLGVASFALPAGILASGFAEQMKQRNFVANWNLVARVPLFNRLAAPKIAAIVAELRLEIAEAGQVIVRKGGPADRMYFIATGEVEVEIEADRPPVVLRQGDFFGEMALIEGGTRRATVAARTRAELLVLEAAAFQRLREDNPELDDAIRKVVVERMAENRVAAAARQA